MTERQPLSFSQGELPRARPGTVSLRFLTSLRMFVTRPAGWREEPPELRESARRASGTLGTKKCSVFPATHGRQVTVTGSWGGKHEPVEPVTMKYPVQFEKEQEAEKNESSLFPFLPPSPDASLLPPSKGSWVYSHSHEPVKGTCSVYCRVYTKNRVFVAFSHSPHESAIWRLCSSEGQLKVTSGPHTDKHPTEMKSIKSWFQKSF